MQLSKDQNGYGKMVPVTSRENQEILAVSSEKKAWKFQTWIFQAFLSLLLK